MTKPNFLQSLWLWLRPGPSASQIAKQLRHPKGRLGEKVAEKMNESNEFLYDFTLDAMQIEDNNNILELGFGNGKFFDKIFSKANNLHVSGIDYSELMVKTARTNNAHLLSEGSLKLLYCNCQSLPFDLNVFDKVFCINVIYFWENPAEFLSEIYRVLKPGGKFYASIRLKDSIKELPYTQYGFALYDEESWKNILIQNKFIYSQGLKIKEPESEINGNRFQFESICLVAQKPV